MGRRRKRRKCGQWGSKTGRGKGRQAEVQLVKTRRKGDEKRRRDNKKGKA